MEGSIPPEDKSRKLAEALLKGWKMLPETCPVCGSPLFETPGGEVICAVCGTKVILVESDEEVRVEEKRLVLERIVGNLISHLEREVHEAGEKLSDETIARINSLLDAIDKASTIYRNLARRDKKRI
ncbi:MAG: hypothetical protein J7L91_03110 [Candidatus Korarchaeota archaeon]|nr:hypothetical protein [Candidatus Korarchaeota archaeon]